MLFTLEADIIIVLSKGGELKWIEFPNDVDLRDSLRIRLPTEHETMDEAAAEIAAMRRIAQRQDRRAEATRGTPRWRRNERRLRERLAIFAERRQRHGINGWIIHKGGMCGRGRASGRRQERTGIDHC